MPDPKPPVAEMKSRLLAKIAELRELEGRARKAPWWYDTAYPHSQYDVSAVVNDAEDKRVFDSLNSDGCCIETTYDGRYFESGLRDTFELIIIARNAFRASLDAHEAFLKQECWDCHDHGRRQVPMNCSYGYVTEECPCGRPAQIQALYEALCGASQ